MSQKVNDENNLRMEGVLRNHDLKVSSNTMV
jgi:hypothetical protein